MYAALCVQVAAFYLVARLEERELRLRFGDRHAAYVASTPSLIFPSLFGEMPSALVRKRAEDVRRAEADKNGFGGGGGMDETLFDVVGEEELEPPRAPTATRPSPRPKPTITKPRAAAVVAPPMEITEVVEDAFVDGEHVADATAPRLAPSPPERETKKNAAAAKPPPPTPDAFEFCGEGSPVRAVKKEREEVAGAGAGDGDGDGDEGYADAANAAAAAAAAALTAADEKTVTLPDNNELYSAMTSVDSVGAAEDVEEEEAEEEEEDQFRVARVKRA